MDKDYLLKLIDVDLPPIVPVVSVKRRLADGTFEHTNSAGCSRVYTDEEMEDRRRNAVLP